MAQLTTFPSAEANWIWLRDFDDALTAGQFVLFRKVFSVEITPSEAIPLHVSADTRYRLYLNGQSISFGPCKSYATHWNYETVDIAPYLRVGQNVLAAKVLRFSSSHPGCLSMIRTSLAGFLLYCNIAGQAIYSDTTWKCKKDDSISLADDTDWDFRLGPQFLKLNERVDGRLAPHGWLTPSYNDSEWPLAVINAATRKMSPMLDPRRLFPRSIPAMTEEYTRFDGVVTSSGTVSTEQWTEFLRAETPLQIPPHSTCSVDIQTETLTTGFIDFACHFDGPNCESPSIEFLFAECYEPPMEPGKPRMKGDRTNHQSGQLYGPRDTYKSYQGLNHYTPFWWRTFRYIRLTITARESPLTVNSFTYRSTHYPLQIGTTIDTKSTEMTKLWSISVNTLRNCMHETYEDCPFYEQNQFAMDSRTQILLTYLLSRDDRLARKSMQEFFASRREDGLVETHYPNPGRSINIPTFSLFWVLMVYDHMVNFGDEKLVKKYIGAVDGVLNYFDERVNDLGLVGQFDPDCWAFVDWASEWSTPGKGFIGLAVPKAYYERGAATYHSLVYAYTLLKASELCTFLGRHDTAKEYLKRHQCLVEAIQTHCYDTPSGFYLDGPGAVGELSQHVQIFALLSGCVPMDKAAEFMRRTILQRQDYGLAKASFAIGFYLFRAASKAGIYEECWDTLIQPWRDMIAQNLTTWAESESMVRSDCHGWSATPLYEIATEILGFKYANETYLRRCARQDLEAQIRINPKQSLLEEASATFVVGKNPEDRFSVSWNANGRLSLSSKREKVVQYMGKAGWEKRTLLDGESFTP